MKPYQQDSIHVIYYSDIYAALQDIGIYQNAARGKTVLELACGTGRILNALSTAKTRTGIDSSANMLDRAQSCERVDLILGDITNINLVQKFELAILALKTINMFDRANRIKIMQNIAKILEPKGRAMIHVSFWSGEIAPGIKSWNTKDGIVTRTQIGTQICKELQTVESTMVYELQLKNGDKIREEESFKIFLPSMTQFIEEAQYAGLQILGYYNISSCERIALLKLHLA